MDLHTAHNQWANRPADERFESIDALQAACENIKHNSEVYDAALLGIKAEAVSDTGLTLVGNAGNKATMTNFAANQLFARLGCSMSSVLNKINAPIAADIINYRVHQLSEEDRAKKLKLLMNKVDVGQDKPIRSIRSITSDSYGRFWNADLIPFLRFAADNGWRVPPARPALANQPGTRVATEADCLNNNKFWGEIKPGDLIAPAGLYASDRNMFAVMVNTDHQIDDGSGRTVSRGMFVENSEVGDGSFWITEFMFANVCGNHIMWGASNVATISYRHVGDKITERIFSALENVKRRIVEWNPADRQREFELLRNYEIASTKDAVVEAVYNMRVDNLLSKKVLEESYEFGSAFGETDGAMPTSPLGLVHGLTRYTQILPNADRRFALEQVGGKILTKFAAIAAR
jgi:hypothetical protein